MKKNYSMRIASMLLVLVLLTTCVISGTFAKYVTSDDATDSATVANWGITLTVDGDDVLYDDSKSGDEVATVVKANDLAAPGTYQKLATVKLTGDNPEVKYTVSAEVTLNLNNWKLTDGTTEYCPLVFTVDGTEYKIASSETVAQFAAKVANAIKLAITGEEDGSATYNAGTAVPTTANEVLIDWTWNFEAIDTYQTNEKDTQLGNAATKPEIEFSLNVTVTQED